MNNNTIEFCFDSSKYSIPDLDYWAVATFGVTEKTIDEFYSKFIDGLIGVGYNKYDIAEYIINFFEIEPNIKRSKYKSSVNETLIDVMDVLHIEMARSGVIYVKLRAKYLNKIHHHHLTSAIIRKSKNQRRIKISF